MLSEFTKQLQMLSRETAGRRRGPAGACRGCLVRLYAYRQATPGHSEVSSQSRKGLQRYTPTAAEWASLTIEPVTEQTFRAEHRHRRQDRGRRGSLDAGVFALCRPGHQAAGAAGRQRHARPAAVRDRSRRHGAGAERFHRRHDRVEQGQVGARSRAVAGQARQGSVRGQGRSAEGLSADPGNPDPGAERSCARRKPRWRRRATNCASSA